MSYPAPRHINLESVNIYEMWDVSGAYLARVVVAQAQGSSFEGGTLAVERSSDGGTSWSAFPTPISLTAEGETEDLDVQTATHIRARVSSAATGTATVRVCASLARNLPLLFNLGA